MADPETLRQELCSLPNRKPQILNCRSQPTTTPSTRQCTELSLWANSTEQLPQRINDQPNNPNTQLSGKATREKRSIKMKGNKPEQAGHSMTVCRASQLCTAPYIQTITEASLAEDIF